ncbi:MAG: PadR family transcriptional regulator [Gudongella sp.]|nr:PadR family transcriptional regulator [Gudongella sp.]
MPDKVLRKVFLGFIHVHILHHAKKEPIYGSWMIHELEEHGYKISPGTLYPLLSGMEVDGLLDKYEKNVGGKVRKYYRITEKGERVLFEAIDRARELFREIES